MKKTSLDWLLPVIGLFVSQADAQQGPADAARRADVLVNSSPLHLGAEFLKALMTGDKALAVALREAASAAGLSASLGDVAGDGGRSAQAFQALRPDQQARVLDSLTVLASGDGLAVLEALDGVEGGFPDLPGSYRRVVVAAKRLDALSASARSPARSLEALQLAAQESESLRSAGFFRLHARLVGFGAEAAKELATLYAGQRAEAEALLERAGGARGGSKDAPAAAPVAAVVLKGPQAAEVVELGYSGDVPHEVIGDCIVGAGQLLRLRPGARIAFHAGARILVNDGGRVLVEGKSDDAAGWVRFGAAKKQGAFTGIQVENGGVADMAGLCVEGAESALIARGAKSLSIRNCVFRECGREGGVGKGAPTLSLDSCKGYEVVIENSLVEGSRGAAMRLHGVAVHIKSCTIRGGKEEAIRGGYFVKAQLSDSRIEGNAGLAMHIEDRSSVNAARCVFVNEHKDFEVLLTKTPDASTFDSCWWGPASVRAAKDLADGKPANLPRLRDGRDAKEEGGAVAVILGKPADKGLVDKVGCKGLEIPR